MKLASTLTNDQQYVMLSLLSNSHSIFDIVFDTYLDHEHNEKNMVSIYTDFLGKHYCLEVSREGEIIKAYGFDVSEFVVGLHLGVIDGYSRQTEIVSINKEAA